MWVRPGSRSGKLHLAFVRPTAQSSPPLRRLPLVAGARVNGSEGSAHATIPGLGALWVLEPDSCFTTLS
jgi:hypothetical protein